MRRAVIFSAISLIVFTAFMTMCVYDPQIDCIHIAVALMVYPILTSGTRRE